MGSPRGCPPSGGGLPLSRPFRRALRGRRDPPPEAPGLRRLPGPVSGPNSGPGSGLRGAIRAFGVPETHPFIGLRRGRPPKGGGLTSRSPRARFARPFRLAPPRWDRFVVPGPAPRPAPGPRLPKRRGSALGARKGRNFRRGHPRPWGEKGIAPLRGEGYSFPAPVPKAPPRCSVRVLRPGAPSGRSAARGLSARLPSWPRASRGTGPAGSPARRPRRPRAGRDAAESSFGGPAGNLEASRAIPAGGRRPGITPGLAPRHLAADPRGRSAPRPALARPWPGPGPT